MAKDSRSGSANGPMDRLKSEALGLVGALGDRAVATLHDKVEDATGRLTDYVEGGAGPGLMAAVTGAKGLAEGKSPARSLLGTGMTAAKEKIRGLFGKGGKDGQGKKQLKLTSIVESIDVGVPARLAYDQWTQFTQFPTFMKKVESVEQADDQKLNWKAQVFWSHRTWEATILEQVPDEKIIWRSKGAKGHVDGAVTFHELAPSMTRILLVMEYHPQGLFERTGNLWRAQGRRARLELKHFRRHLMREVLLHPEDVEGWRGTIHDGEVAQDHESALAEEQQQGARDEQQEILGEEEEQEQVREEAGDEYEDEDAYQDEYEKGEKGEEGEPEGEPEYESEDEDEDTGRGEAARDERRGRPSGDGEARTAARGRRPARRPQRTGRSGADEDQRPRRTVRPVGARGGESS
jgi:uncharacterized membrane protein